MSDRLRPRDIIALEREVDRDPSNYPWRTPSQSKDAYWAYWTPARLEEWRRTNGKPPA